ncbi:MAG TPA: cupin domain-containing protein [Hyphomonadaceae bacterium]|nr:cupin domain-containing protein [Hyphomonadaceae bacterium]
MTLHDNAYAAFMLDYAAGALSPAETLAADLHRALSARGARNARMADAVGGAMLEKAKPALTGHFDGIRLGDGADKVKRDARLDPYLRADLLALPWRKNIFGLQTLGTSTPMASLLRLDPGERAPGHGHGRRDVAVVLCGSFADEFGVYETGDLAFAEPGMKHQPRAVGDRSCVCLLAAEPGKPVSGFLGMFGIGPGAAPRRRA